MKPRIAVRGVFVHDGKLLAVKLKPYHHRVETDFWCTPGGGVDAGEALTTALERELTEELGIKPEVGNLLYVHQFKSIDKEHLEFFFNILNSSDYQHVDLAKTTHGQEEIEQIGYIDPAGQNILPEFLSTEPIAEISNTQPAKFFSYL